jgi:chemotaxis response regulator CheB
MRNIIKQIIAVDDELEVAGEAEDGAVAIEKDRELKPEVILLDIEMPKLDGLSALKRLKLTSKAKVVILSSVAQLGSPAANEVRLSRLGARLAGLLSTEDSEAFRRELDSAGPDAAFDVLDRLADRLADLRESGVAFAERTLQLELALGVLRERDKAAAEQSEWDFAADLQTSSMRCCASTIRR